MARTYNTIYKCRECGSTCYLPVIARAANGNLLPTGQYKCAGCRNIFPSIRAWWEPQPPELKVVGRAGLKAG